MWDRFGRYVGAPVDEPHPRAGRRVVNWDCGQHEPGYYIVRVTAGSTSESQFIQVGSQPVSSTSKKKKGILSQLRWVKPGTPLPAPTEAFALPPQPYPTTSTRLALELYGLPQVPHTYQRSALGEALARTEPSVLSEARYLLKAAAEIEHGLLIQYLYAKYSINLTVPNGQGQTWAKTIRDIAVQEMDHLVTVQNLLLALRNNSFQTYFDRANFPIPPEDVPYYPYAFRLEPFSGDSLAKYVSVESPLPETIGDIELRTKLEEVIERAKKATDMASIGHVGNLYALLYWLFLESDTAAEGGPWPNFPADYFRCWRPGRHLSQADFADVSELEHRQAIFSEFSANDGNSPNYPHNDMMPPTHQWVFKVRNAKDAQRTIAQIAIQGEGTEMAMDSHFLEFLDVYDKVALLPSGTSSHLEVPTNPNLGNDPSTADGRIVNEETELWALLCNTRYLILLQKLPLALSFRRDNGAEQAKRSTLITSALQEMLTGIRYFATRLVTMPRADDPNKFAGPVFELPDDYLPSTANEQWNELVRLINVTAKLLPKIRALTGTGQPNTLDKRKLDMLEQWDKAILQIVPTEFQPPPPIQRPPTTRGNGVMANQQLNSFADVQTFFNQFVIDNGTDIGLSPHGAFWNTDYDSFVNGDVPGVPGVKILVPGDPDHSNLILLLRGPLHDRHQDDFADACRRIPFHVCRSDRNLG